MTNSRQCREHGQALDVLAVKPLISFLGKTGRRVCALRVHLSILHLQHRQNYHADAPSLGKFDSGTSRLLPDCCLPAPTSRPRVSSNQIQGRKEPVPSRISCSGVRIL